jgi:pimeloyl-ACP methyl ester carboxylesterase
MTRHGRRADVAADWAFHADDAAVFEALGLGTHATSLREYFGAPGYAELSQLAAAARQATPRKGPRVLMLPGIMGSKLGRPGLPHAAPQVLWIDPLAIANSGLLDLALPKGRALVPMGVLLFSYARLKLRLQIAGFEMDFYPYDWRLSLDESGSALAAHIAAIGEPVHIVAHSMGGLVARMAAAKLPKRCVRKLILLATPNLGSYAPIQALRGTYPFVRKVATLDLAHTPEFLAANAFCSFPGLYQLLPVRRDLSGTDIYDAATWPANGPAPDARLLAQAESVFAALAPADSRMRQIVGVNRETVVGVRRRGNEFEYDLGMNGDGTVPLALARLPRLETYYVEETHSNLANNALVTRAVIDLLRRGRTTLLPRRWRAKHARLRRTNDAKLRLNDGGKIDWRRLNSAEREATLAELDDGHATGDSRSSG